MNYSELLSFDHKLIAQFEVGSFTRNILDTNSRIHIYHAVQVWIEKMTLTFESSAERHLRKIMASDYLVRPKDGMFRSYRH